MAKDKSPAFQFYPDAWLSSTDISLMTPSEEGAYIRLLCHAWMQDDCGIPRDDAALAVLSRLGKQWDRGSGEKIRRKFEDIEGRLYNKRLLEERKKQEDWSAHQSKAGRAGAKKRWPKDSDPNGVAIGLPSSGIRVAIDGLIPKHSSSSSSSSSSSEIPPNPQDRGVDVGEELGKSWAALWLLDPYGMSEMKAMAKFMELLRDAVTPVQNARAMVANRRAWLAHCKAINLKATGTLRWLEDGDCFKAPPAIKAAPSESRTIYREATDDE